MLGVNRGSTAVVEVGLDVMLCLSQVASGPFVSGVNRDSTAIVEAVLDAVRDYPL